MNELSKLYQLFQAGECKLVFELLDGLNYNKIDFLEQMFNDNKVYVEGIDMYQFCFTHEYLHGIVLNIKYSDNNEVELCDLWLDNAGWHTLIHDANDSCNYIFQTEEPDWKLKDFLQIIIDEINGYIE